MTGSFDGGAQAQAGGRSPRELAERPMPQLFDISGRRPVRFRRLYRQLERVGSVLHQTFYAGGTTEQDRSLSFPCDAYVLAPRVACYRGIEVLAPREIVYRWLCQIRVAPYSYDWFDNFGRRSPRQLTPGLQRLAAGQPLLVMFRIIEFEENEHITVVGETYEWIAGQRLAMTYRVVPRTSSSCRIVTKLVGCDAPDTFLHRLRRECSPIGEFPLMHKQMRTIKQLAERQFLEELAEGRRSMPDGVAAGVGPLARSVRELVAQAPNRE